MLDFAYEAEQGILLIHYFCACKATSVALCSEVKLFATTYCEQQSLYRSAVGGDLVATANIQARIICLTPVVCLRGGERVICLAPSLFRGPLEVFRT